MLTTTDDGGNFEGEGVVFSSFLRGQASTPELTDGFK
jgi:hypothetical protein